MARAVPAGILGTIESHASRTETAAVDDGVSDVRQLSGAIARSSRANGPPTGGAALGLERVAIGPPAPDRATVSAAALLNHARRMSYGRNSGGLFETGARLLPSAVAPNPERNSPTDSRQQSDSSSGHPHGPPLFVCTVRTRLLGRESNTEYAYLRARSEVSFVYSNDGDQLRFDKRTEVHDDKAEQKELRYAGLRRKDGYYRYGPLDLANDNARVAVRPFPLRTEMKGWLSEDFDPLIFTKVEMADRTVQAFCKFYYDNKDNKELLPMSIGVDGDLIIAKLTDKPGEPDSLLWVYHFDMTKGGLPVFVEGGSRSGKDVVSTWHNRFVEVDGTWLPDKMEVSINNEGKATIDTRSITFSDHRLNGSLDETEFEVKSLPLRQGDKLLDTASGEWNRIGKKKKTSLVPVDTPQRDDQRIPLKHVFVIINLSVIAILILFLVVKKMRRRTRL